MLWQPSDKSLRNVELDEAGKLAAFRSRFGRGWDLEGKPEEATGETVTETGAQKDVQDTKDTQTKAAAAPAPEPAGADQADDGFDSLADLISGYAAQQETAPAGGGLSAKEQAKKDKKKKK